MVELIHQGDANVIIGPARREWGVSGPNGGLVTEISPSDGSRTITIPGDGISLFSVQANGPWTITVQ
jgi:hypothetical protein